MCEILALENNRNEPLTTRPDQAVPEQARLGASSRRGLVGCWEANLRLGGKNRINEVGNERDLVVEFGFACVIEVLLSTPGCPLGLADSAVAFQMWTDGFKRDAAVLSDGFGRSP